MSRSTLRLSLRDFRSRLLRHLRPVCMALGVLSVASAQTGAPSPATLTVPAPGSAQRQTALDAVVESVRQATLSTQVPGTVVAIPVKAGDRVRAGQELLRIDARAAQQQVLGSVAQLEAARAQLRVAQQEFERQQQLFQQQYISQAALDRARLQWESAQAQLQATQAQSDAAKVQSGFFTVVAPFAGVVSEIPVTLGDMAMPGRALVLMHDPSVMRLSAAIPQGMMGALSGKAEGLKYEIPGLAPAGAQAVTQYQLLPAVDAQTHTAIVRVTLPALSGLVPGMHARLYVPAGEGAASPAIWIPAQAVVRRLEMTGVYVVDAQGQARLRQVRLGRRSGEQVEVLTGLAGGETLLAQPHLAGALRDNPKGAQR